MTVEPKRVEVPLIPKSQQALARLAETTGLNQSDVINRALQFYDLAETWTRVEGSYLAVVDRDGLIERVSWS